MRRVRMFIGPLMESKQSYGNNNNNNNIIIIILFIIINCIFI